VECNHEGNHRLEEYSPVNFENATLGKIKGRGRVYMNWLVNTLKPEIDAKYRTLPDRLNTIICGSSMGGLMALYGATVYNHIFQRGACLSPSLWVSPGKVLEIVARAHIRRDTCIYMDYGSEEMFNHAANAEALISTSHLLLTKRVNLALRVVPGGNHSEASWEKQIPIFMDCLGL
jgi:predicted alpha/beta superfamily hydrolase